MIATQPRLPGFTQPEHRPGASLSERFVDFMAANPWVLDRLELLADEAVAQGAHRIGVKWLVEVMRWQHLVDTHGEPWRLNNSYTSRLARALIARRPDLADRIETRELRS